MKKIFWYLCGLILLSLWASGCGPPIAPPEDVEPAPAWSWNVEIAQLELPSGMAMKPGGFHFKAGGGAVLHRWPTNTLQRAYVLQHHRTLSPRTARTEIGEACWVDELTQIEPGTHWASPATSSCPCAGGLDLRSGNRWLMHLEPNNLGRYPGITQRPAPWRIWSPDQPVRLQAEGSEDIPAFANEMLLPSPPAELLLKLRHGERDGLPLIATTEDLDVFWSFAPGRLVIGFEQPALDENPDQVSRVALCNFDGTLGVGSIPLELLAMLEPERATRMVVYRQRDHREDSGEARIHIRLLNGVARDVALLADE